jgi:polyketide cyclase/dehydrase/lipid transport protein
VRDPGRFDFLDEWRVAAPLEAVGAVLREVETWPRWWPVVRRVSLLSRDSGSAVWQFRFRTRLPYDIEFAAEVLDEDPLSGVQVRVTGRLAGEGGWRAEPVQGGTLVRFDWWVRPQLAWMRAVAPLARPVFSWNHRSLMAEGAFGLARQLDTGLLAKPVGVLRPV